VDDHIQTIIREEFGGDRSAFIRTLEAQGYTLARFRETEVEKIIVQAMRQKNVKSDLIVSPQLIQDYYSKNRLEYSTPEQIHLRMIVIKKAGSAGRKMTEEIRQKVTSGADFDKMAQMYSQDSSQESGGDWGWIDRKTLNENLTKIAFSLKPGETSRVVELNGNCYLLYCEAKKSAVTKPMKEVHDTIETKLLQEQRQKAQQKWIETLRAKAYIKMF
jgi:peptidyl-prolyl cis-trans isomerase SurA